MLGLCQPTATAALTLQLFLLTEISFTKILGGVSPLSRQKRDLFQLCNLMVRYTNRGCLNYMNYGCFCGLGNAASSHVDAVDGCCRVHDRCYGNVECYWLYPQFVGYNVNCTAQGCQCTDNPQTRACAYTTCQCDVQFAECLGRAQYNHGFSNYDRDNCQVEVRERGRRSIQLHHRKRSKTATQQQKHRYRTF